MSYPYIKNVMAAGDTSIMYKISLNNQGQSASKLLPTATRLARVQKRTLQVAFHLDLPLAVDHKGQVLLREREV